MEPKPLTVEEFHPAKKAIHPHYKAMWERQQTLTQRWRLACIIAVVLLLLSLML